MPKLLITRLVHEEHNLDSDPYGASIGFQVDEAITGCLKNGGAIHLVTVEFSDDDSHRLREHPHYRTNEPQAVEPFEQDIVRSAPMKKAKKWAE